MYFNIREGAESNIILFANANSKSERKNLTLRMSFDQGENWTDGRTIYAGSSAYSSLTVLPNGNIGLIFEKDNYQENVFVSLTLDWLSGEK